MKHTERYGIQLKNLVFFSNFSKISKFPVILMKRDSFCLKKLVFLLKQTIFHDKTSVGRRLSFQNWLKSEFSWNWVISWKSSDFHGDTLNGRAFTEKNVSFPLEIGLLKFGKQSIENEQLWYSLGRALKCLVFMEIIKFSNGHNFLWRWIKRKQAVFWKYLFYFESGGLRAFPFFIIVCENPFIWMGILFILYIWWSHCKIFATFTFGADIPSLGDFSGQVVILEKNRKIYFKNFWVSLRSIFFHLVWIELIWEW